MKLKNIVLFFPAALSSCVLKSIKTKMDDDLKQYIEDNSMYHFTSREATQKIMDSGMIKASSAIASYGLPASFMFAGIPDMDVYAKNVEGPKNIFNNPAQIRYAIKLNATKRDLANYKVRKYQDGAIVYEGNCVLDDQKAEIKQLVFDLIKDADGNEKVGLRERTNEEIEKYGDKYIPSKEFLEALAIEKQNRGYHDSNFLFRNDIVAMSDAIDTEIESSVKGIKQITKSGVNGIKQIKKSGIKEFFSKIVGHNKTLGENIEKQLKRNIDGIEQGDISTKRPVRSSKYTKTIVELNKNGIKQKTLSEEMENLQNSEKFNYMSKKATTMDKSSIKKFGLRGIGHNNRVAILATSIVNGEGTQMSDKDFDILVSACFLHDIGRIIDVGPHAKRSAKKIGKMNFTTIDGEEYSDEDKRLLQFLAEGHESGPKVEDKLIKKYKIPEERAESAKRYLAILKDADALDRARLSSKFNMDLDARFLRTDTAKSLVNFSFDLEGLSKRVDLQKVMNEESTKTYEQNKEEKESQKKTKDDKFFDDIENLVNRDVTQITTASKESLSRGDIEKDDGIR